MTCNLNSHTRSKEWFSGCSKTRLRRKIRGGGQVTIMHLSMGLAFCRAIVAATTDWNILLAECRTIRRRTRTLALGALIVW